MSNTTTPGRVQRKRTAGWRMPANTVYVGRGSAWGNPFRPGTDTYGEFVVDRRDAVRMYRAWLYGTLIVGDVERERRYIVEHLVELAGFSLACWCPPNDPCHADVLLKLANGGRA